MLELGPRGRTWFCAVFFGSEALLIATASMRADRSYGFRMFPEASSVTLHVSRRLEGGQLVPIAGGHWQARDCSGGVHEFVWSKMVRWPAPSRLDTPLGASYGVESELGRARDAMRWVLAHTPDDCETRALVARIEAKKNGRVLDPMELEVTR
ncbi:MAG TPA: hypothetical protein VIF15_18575 [Polyangiaceae bacterium]|jgi:hypothetical protein